VGRERVGMSTRSESEASAREFAFLREMVQRLTAEARDSDLARAQQNREYEERVSELEVRNRALAREIERLQRRPANPREFEALPLRLRQQLYQRDVVARRNEELAEALEKTRQEVLALRWEIEKLTAPPCPIGVFLEPSEDSTALVMVGGRKMKVNLHPQLDPASVKRGQEVVLNDALNIVKVMECDAQGEVVQFEEMLDDGRCVIRLRADEKRVAELADVLRAEQLKPGDKLLCDVRSGYLVEKLPKGEVEELLLEEIPDVTYDDIGGLHQQVEQLRDAIELPYLHLEEFREHQLLPPKGVLLYGPPGCGKTLLAKAMANSLARRVQEKTGRETRTYFLNVKGPELLDKYVGETERKIREVFRRAKEKAQEGAPVVIFFDEMDALFRTRGSGISSDVESSIVPQFLSEIDGVEGLRNVIVVGASNRQDLIDPAVLRPGRMNVKINIDRPDRAAAADIFWKYLKPDLPLAREEVESAGGREAAARHMIEAALDEMFSTAEDKKFLEVTYASSDRETLYFKDFVSGAMIESVVSRAKKMALKRLISGGHKGIASRDLAEAVREEFHENEDLPNTTNPDDWVKIAGRRGERIVHVRGLARRVEEAKKVETMRPGHYL
jgi:proteasome-associated ATPase